MKAELFDDRVCDLGEGPIWLAARQTWLWFDITGRRMLARDAQGASQAWEFETMHSAAGEIDAERVLLAHEHGLDVFSFADGTRRRVCLLEADDAETRSNDGRADPFGGFWIGTMGKRAEAGRGALYRFYRGTVRRLFAGLTIPNAIAFAPDQRRAYFTDTSTRVVQSVALDAEGWPIGTPEPFLRLDEAPDGAVVDARGVMWLALWGAGRVSAFDPTGAPVASVSVDAPHTSCPALGGPQNDTLLITTARQGLDTGALAAAPRSGCTFARIGGFEAACAAPVLLDDGDAPATDGHPKA